MRDTWTKDLGNGRTEIYKVREVPEEIRKRTYGDAKVEFHEITGAIHGEITVTVKQVGALPDRKYVEDVIRTERMRLEAEYKKNRPHGEPLFEKK
jgi:hypothetical protein